MDSTALPVLGAPRAPSVAIPGRSGILPVPATSQAEGTLALSLLVPEQSGGALAMAGQVASILGHGRVVTVTRTDTAGRRTTCRARLSSTIAPETLGYDGDLRLKVTMALLDAGWAAASTTRLVVAGGGQQSAPADTTLPARVEQVLWRAQAATMTCVTPAGAIHVENLTPGRAYRIMADDWLVIDTGSAAADDMGQTQAAPLNVQGSLSMPVGLRLPREQGQYGVAGASQVILVVRGVHL